MTFLNWLKAVVTNDADYFKGYRWVLVCEEEGLSHYDIVLAYQEYIHTFSPSFARAVRDELGMTEEELMR